ncbi:hypothetical protein BGW39_007525 [Mortierella sp. 14UC]|nr:hypothetical protein BGW39_007525 [Mortierella sp. 14UC]
MVIKYTDYDTQGNKRDLTLAELDYIHGQEFLDMYLADRKDAACLKDPYSHDHLRRYYPNVVYREAIWSLAEPILEQLEHLTFLLSDLRRYHNNVGRLAKLEHLHVRHDLVFHCYCCSDTPEAEPRVQREQETLRMLIQFVKDHIKLFPGRLKTFYSYGTEYWKEPQFCPRAVTDEIYRILPAHFKPDNAPAQPAWSKHGLVKLQRVTLQECRMPSRELDTIAIAFSQSLFLIDIKDIQVADNVQTIHIGRSWIHMPALSRFELQSHSLDHRLALGPQLLSRCPSLTSVRIKDRVFEYSCQDVIPCLSAHLPRLKSLHLKGWSALTFNPAILKSTEALLDLKLSMSRPLGYCFIPPADELDGPIDAANDGASDEPHAMTPSIARPTWTWDWNLPRLGELDLSSEFAYRFEFRVLQGCPSLGILRLHMRTVEGLHTRLISEADLFIPGGTDGAQERIVAPKLRKLYMNGRWVIKGPSVLSQLLGGMFPKLERLVARGWDRVTVESMVEAIRTTAGHIRMVRTDLDGPSEEEEAELRMCRRSCIHMKTRAFLRNRLFCSGVEYVLREE